LLVRRLPATADLRRVQHAGKEFGRDIAIEQAIKSAR